MRPGWHLCAPLVVWLLLACVTTAEEQMAGWRERAVSRATFGRVLPFLEDLRPGADLRIFEAARRVYPQGRGGAERPIVVIPSWITSLSGGAAGGLSMFGQLVGRRDDVIHGSHVFGFVSGTRIVPRYQVLTSATVVGVSEFEELTERRSRGVGVLPRPSGILYFRDLHVAGARPLDFPEPPAVSGGSDARLPRGGLAAFYSEESFHEIAQMLGSLPVGTDLFSLLWALEAEFVSDDFGETHSLLAPGFLNTRTVRTQTLEGPDGVFKLRPFGWVEREGGREIEVVKRIAIFENDRLRRVVRHSGRANWASYLAE